MARESTLSSSEIRELGARIAIVRGERSQAGFGRPLGLHQNTLSRYERGEREPGFSVLKQICLAYGIRPHWLLFGTGPMLLSEPAPADVGPDRTEAHKPASWAPMSMREESGTWEGNAPGRVLEPMNPLHALRPNFAQQTLGIPVEFLTMVPCRENSMEPTIPEGSMCFVDRRGTAIDRDGIFCLEIDGGLIIRRIQRLPGGCWNVRSDNPLFEAFRLDPDSYKGEFSLIGRVCGIIHQL